MRLRALEMATPASPPARGVWRSCLAPSRVPPSPSELSESVSSNTCGCSGMYDSPNPSASNAAVATGDKYSYASFTAALDMASRMLTSALCVVLVRPPEPIEPEPMDVSRCAKPRPAEPRLDEALAGCCKLCKLSPEPFFELDLDVSLLPPLKLGVRSPSARPNDREPLEPLSPSEPLSVPSCHLPPLPSPLFDPVPEPEPRTLPSAVYPSGSSSSSSSRMGLA